MQSFVSETVEADNDMADMLLLYGKIVTQIMNGILVTQRVLVIVCIQLTIYTEF